VAVVESTATVFAALAKSPSRAEGTAQEFRRLPEISGPDAEARGPSELLAGVSGLSKVEATFSQLRGGERVGRV
jgi:hypothetical protein